MIFIIERFLGIVQLRRKVNRICIVRPSICRLDTFDFFLEFLTINQHFYNSNPFPYTFSQDDRGLNFRIFKILNVISEFSAFV